MTVARFVMLPASAACAVAIAIVAAVGLDAQTPATTPAASFDVASVKANKSGDNRVMLGGQLGAGRFTASNVPLLLLIQSVYRVQPYQVVGVPDWVRDTRFDISAKAADADANRDQLNEMMKTLLQDRFKLAVHTETRELPIYAIVPARADRRLGPNISVSTTDCAAAPAGPDAGRGRGGPPPGPPPPGEPMRCGTAVAPGSIRTGGGPIAQLARTLSQTVGRVVVDKTGLAGNYDLSLTYTPEQLPQGPLPPGVTFPQVDPNGPSIFTAMQEQLGLKLDSQRGPVEVMVIDRVEQPTED